LSEVLQYLKHNHNGGGSVDFDSDDITSLIKRLRSSSSHLPSPDNTSDLAVTERSARRRRGSTPGGDRSKMANDGDFRLSDTDDDKAFKTKTTAIRCNVEALHVQSMTEPLDRHPTVHRQPSHTLMTCKKLRRAIFAEFAAAEIEIACVVVGDPTDGEGGPVTGSVNFGEKDYEIYSTAADVMRHRRPTTSPLKERTLRVRAASSSTDDTEDIVIVTGRQDRQRSKRTARKGGESFSGIEGIGGIIEDGDIGIDWTNTERETLGAIGDDDGAAEHIDFQSNSDRTAIESENEDTGHTDGTGQGHKCVYAGNMQKIAHLLHYCSVGILGIFVLQV